MRPYSDNVIFWDTEFTSLDPYKGELLSIGMVKRTGEEFYVELEVDESLLDPWVNEHVIPHMQGNRVSRQEAIRQVFEFIGEGKPYLVSFVNQYDVVYLYKAIGIPEGGTKNFPFNWIHIDIASMLFGNGIDPERFRNAHANSLGKQHGTDPSQYREHHALDDAKQLRDLYLKLTPND